MKVRMIIKTYYRFFRSHVCVFFFGLKELKPSKPSAWTFNYTLFTGDNAIEKRDNFQKELNELLERFKINNP